MAARTPRDCLYVLLRMSIGRRRANWAIAYKGRPFAEESTVVSPAAVFYRCEPSWRSTALTLYFTLYMAQ